MENSCLNLAHFYGRKAENHLRCRRYDDSIASHQKAAELLDEAIAKTTTTKLIESLQLQRDQHLKYKDFVLMKKDYFDKYTRALEQQKQKNAEAMEQMAKNRIENSCQLQLAIYKTMEDTDSLLEVLCNKASGPSDISGKQSDTTASYTKCNVDATTTTVSTKRGQKIPKDDSTVIEELRTLNYQLHILIFQLVSQLDEVNQESESLREKVKHLERTRNVQTILPTPLLRPINVFDLDNHANVQPLNILKDCVVNDIVQSERENKTSESAVLLSSGEQSPDVSAGTEELPPLELPTFDYTTFDCKK